MSPERARVLIAEDRKLIRDEIKKDLEKSGHQVLIEAGSVEEAMMKIKEAKEKGINVAVLDGSLPADPEDGPQIAAALRKEIPGIRIVALSGMDTDWGDLNLSKPDDVWTVGEHVRNLT